MPDPAPEPLDLLDSLRAPQLRSLVMEHLSERFMRQIAFALFQRMRHSVQLLSCINAVITHETAMAQLPEIMLAGICDLAPLRGRLLLAIDGELIGAMVDALCGATAPHPFERYELSSMESRVGKQMIELALGTIAETLAPLTPLNLTPIAFENDNGMLAIADGQDWMITVTGIFETPLGTGSIKLITPYAGFEPLETKFSALSGLIGGRGADDSWTHAAAALAERTPVELRFELARATLPLTQVQALHAGQILPIVLWADAIAVCDGQDLFRADYGQCDGFICCRIQRPATARTQDPATSPGDATMADPQNRTLERTLERPEAERVELERLQPQPRGLPAITGKKMLDRVHVAITVELGRANITVKALRQLRHGQILALEQRVGEPLTIYANGEKLAYGEVVAAGQDHYGVRVTALVEDIDSASDSAE
jgi:flagellar motor switch protein FliM